MYKPICIFSLFLTFTIFVMPVYAEKNIPAGSFSNDKCISCHEKSTPEIVTGWRASTHAGFDSNKKAQVDCTSCHGKEHTGSAERARKNTACINCHGGESSLVHSYITSKHGVIATIEGPNWDWSAPLTEGLYRSPTCAYCHLHNSDHNVSTKIGPWNPQQTPKRDNPDITKAREEMGFVCADCHSARFITTYLDTGDRMLEVGRMKVREAATVIANLEKKGLLPVKQVNRHGELPEIRYVFEEMRLVHMKNLWYGIAHQSPDYQWWNGHPALDQDLLHIKALSTRLRRQQLIHQ